MKTAAKKFPTVSTAGKTLVVVESPAKAKTIEKYLGKNYVVRASMGHLRDLPKSQFGIDIENDFAPKYINIRGKAEIINDLKKAAQGAAKVYLASDPDREGEAIAWHLAYLLGIDPKTSCRIDFHEITKPAILAAVKSPRPIALDRVDAQQARRLLDRIVGYQLSPLLWRKVKKGLSAGRVQSVSVRLIVDREKEIEKFVSQEYWTIGLKLKKDKPPIFLAALSAIDGKKLDEKKGDKWLPSIPDEKTALAIAADIEKYKNSITVAEVKKSRAARKAPPPFNTSSLQQDAARKLGFTSRKTMMLAQQLYEGIGLGTKGPVGLITYMRTDSVRLSADAVNAVRDFIGEKFGKPYVPAKPHIYSSKNAQDAHEAIRPTDAARTPEEVEKFLTADQWKLYRLIWQRFVACQMADAIYDRLAVKIAAGDKYICRTGGSTLQFPGFTAVYAGAEEKQEKDVKLPDLAQGDKLALTKIMPEQHFTEPPPRYNEASLVKELEEKGIGRPSTYAPIIETIIARGYVIRSGKQFSPTELGRLVVAMLEEYFEDIVDVKFTAEMEDKLDEVAEGHITKNRLLSDFYAPFSQTLAKADKAIGNVEVKPEESDVECEFCGRKLVIRQGRYGKFLACPGFPDCRNTKPIQKSTGAKCPLCGGDILERKSRRGKVFYGCAKYPDCSYVSWDEPLTVPCKTCGSLMLRHRYKNGRVILYCNNDACPTRANHPINREIERQAAKAEKSAATKSVAAAKKPAATKPKKKSAAPKAASLVKSKNAAAKKATKTKTIKK